MNSMLPAADASLNQSDLAILADALASLTHPTRRLTSLVQPLWDGELDLIGDVHGEIQALDSLLGHLGYAMDGSHPQGRRLVFLGDLVDRGPDTLAVLSRVLPMLASGRAQAVLGNHEFNLLKPNKTNAGNWWFYGQGEPDPQMPQKLLPAELREGIRAWVKTLPVVLERADLRVVHAAWIPDAVEQARASDDAWTLHVQAEARIEKELARKPAADEVEANLLKQNSNPLKVLTSGLEQRSDKVITVWGKQRLEQRTPWWNDYDSPVFCVIGHYSRVSTMSKDSSDLFAGLPPEQTLGQSQGPDGGQDQGNDIRGRGRGNNFRGRGRGKVMCVDWSVGYRCQERAQPGAQRVSALVALRWPQRQLVLDDGRVMAMRGSQE